MFPLRTALVGDVSSYLAVLLGAVGFVLLIVCANLASANLARGTARAHEMAVRVALGAGRGRLVRQLLVEHLLPALAGGAAGVGLALLGVRAFLASSAAARIPRASEIAVDVRVLAFALGVSVLAGLLSGLLPALRASGRGSLRDAIALGGGARGAVRGGRTLPGAVLIAAEFALALVLLAGAGLLIRSFRTLLERGIGFDSGGMVMAELTLSPRRYADSTRSVAYWEALLASLGGVPGVTAAGAANWVPLGTSGTSFVELAERPGDKVPGAGYRAVSDDYFRALGVPLLSGRFFGRGDVLGSERVVIVNRAAAQLYWPGENPLGRSLRTPGMEGLRPAWLTVVGVVGDVRQGGLERDAAPEVYVLYRQMPMWARSMTAVVRGRLPAEQLVGVVRERIRAQDPQIVTEVEPFAARLDESIAERRLIMSLLTGFGAFALALAAVGVYGVLSFGVAQRTREIAVRAALGAERGRLLRLVLAGALRVVAAGVAVGLAGASFLSVLVRGMLVDVSPTDPASFAAATLLLVAVGLLAGLVPAWRAARVEPAEALRAG